MEPRCQDGETSVNDEIDGHSIEIRLSQREFDKWAIDSRVIGAILKALDDSGPVLPALVDITQVASIVFAAIERGDIPNVKIEY